MELTIFNDLTTEDYLAGLEAESKRYEGLYVEMSVAEERKYVKDKAVLINDLLKKVDRARIDKAKDFKASVEAEAKSIRERLEEANKPFTLLIDEYAAECKKKRDAKKAIEDEKERLALIESDHEFGLMLNDKFDRDRKDAEAERIANQERLQRIANEQAQANAAAEIQKAKDDAEAEKQAAIQREIGAKARLIQQQKDAEEAARLAAIKAKQDVEQAKQDAIDAQNAAIEADRLAKEKAANDMAHVKAVRLAVKKAFIDAGLPEEHAITAGKLVVSNGVPNTQFNY